MKFCMKCGAQMMDEAIICTGCGCSVVGEQQVIPQRKKKSTLKENQWLVPIFNFISTVLSSFSAFFLVLSVIVGDVSTHVWSYSISSYYYPNFALALIAFIISIITLASAAVGLIFSILKRQKGDDFFSPISKVLIAGLLLIASILAFLRGA